MKTNYIFILLFSISLFAKAQTGNTISEAISVNGEASEGSILNIDSNTSSNLVTDCTVNSGDDTFYVHTVNSGANKLTINFNCFEAGIALLAQAETFEKEDKPKLPFTNETDILVESIFIIGLFVFACFIA